MKKQSPLITVTGETCVTGIDIAMASGGLDMLGDKIVLKVHMLDNSSKTLLITATATAEEVTRSMAEKMNFSNPEMSSFFALFEALDGASCALDSMAQCAARGA